jgi:hypothetical protein
MVKTGLRGGGEPATRTQGFGAYAEGLRALVARRFTAARSGSAG